MNPLTSDIGRGYNHISSGIGAVMIRWRSDPAKALRTPHTAFHDPSFPDARIRESIEFRTIAYFE